MNQIDSNVGTSGERVFSGASGDGQVSEDSQASLVIEPRDIIAFFRRRYLTLAITTLVSVAVGLIIFSQITPRYEATSTVLLDNARSQVVDIDAVMVGVGTGESEASAQTAILKSRAIAVRVADRLNLWDDPKFNLNVATLSAPSSLNPLNWFGGSDDEAGPEDDLLRQDRMDALSRQVVVESIRSRMTVAANRTTQTIDISFESDDPARAAEIVNTIADEYVLDQLEAKYEATRNAATWLSGRLEEMRTTLDAAERAVEQYKADNDLVNADGLLLSEQELSELNGQLILIRAELAEKQAIYSRAQQILSRGGSLESVTEVLQSPVILALRQQQGDLARKEADLSSRYGPRHPQMINVQAERRDLDAQIQQEIARIVDSLKNNVAVVRSRERSIEASLEDRRAFALENNRSLVQLRALEREAEATRTLYEVFLNRFKEVSEQETLQVSGVRVISPAVAPTVAAYPKFTLFIGGALMAGLLLGSALAVGQELFDDTFHTAQDCERLLGTPTITAVPLVGGDNAAEIASEHILGNPLSPYSEAFRRVRTSLELSNVDNPPQVILFTSAVPSEGKTTASTSFALAAARAGKKVVIVDCDLRKPSVQKVFSREPVDKGLVEYLANPTSIGDIIQKHERSGADYIPVGRCPINPTEVLGSQHMSDLLTALRAEYDLVVIDSAPVLPVSDTQVVAKMVDATIFVIRWGQTPRAAVANAIKQFQRSNGGVVGTMLSAVDMDKQSAYGYGDDAYIYGNYGDYYSS